MFLLDTFAAYAFSKAFHAFPLPSGAVHTGLMKPFSQSDNMKVVGLVLLAFAATLNVASAISGADYFTDHSLTRPLNSTDTKASR